VRRPSAFIRGTDPPGMKPCSMAKRLHDAPVLVRLLVGVEDEIDRGVPDGVGRRAIRLFSFRTSRRRARWKGLEPRTSVLPQGSSYGSHETALETSVDAELIPRPNHSSRHRGDSETLEAAVPDPQRTLTRRATHRAFRALEIVIKRGRRFAWRMLVSPTSLRLAISRSI
jgi:hypothetical protein